jgi:hypothetical protein
MKKLVSAMFEAIYQACTYKILARRTERLRSALSEQLRIEIRDAHQHWQAAINRFQYADGADQIDFAVYSLEAAQKRYEMLIRSAKKHEMNRYIEIK